MMKRALGVMLAGAVLLVGWPMHVAAIATQPQSGLAGMSCVSATFCESVGFGPNNAGYYVTLAETWNGKSWTGQPTPNPAGLGTTSLQGVSCVAATFCEAVGGALRQAGTTSSTLAEVWNGSTWAIQPTPNPAGSTLSYLDGVSCVSATFCEAVGFTAGTATVPLAEIWDGTSWTLQSPANPATAYSVLNAVSCVSVTSCEAVGYAEGPGYATLAEAWDGTGWTLQSTPNPVATGSGYIRFRGVSCVSAGDCEAVGYGSANEPTLAERWNGTSWALQSTPTVAGATPDLFGVSCFSAGDCEAVGDVSGVAIAEVWNGTTWTVQSAAMPSQMKSATLVAVSCVSAVACEASGSGMHNAGRGLPLTEGWNGTSWTAQ